MGPSVKTQKNIEGAKSGRKYVKWGNLEEVVSVNLVKDVTKLSLRSKKWNSLFGK
jgi:hypothetical protein